ncbi:MAG: homoserine O-succinyltransferase [Gemmatimonadota bacterium]
MTGVTDPPEALPGEEARHPGGVGVVELPGGLALEREEAIVPCRIGYEWVGNPTGPLVFVLGGISADRHVGSHVEADAPGWWDAFIGPEKALDTRRLRVVGMDWIGGPGGSSGPMRAPGPEGIPAVTSGDQAAAMAAVLDHLGVERAHGIVGASYGAMVGLAFGARFPERVDRIVAIAGAHESHPMATALRSLQRRIVLFGYELGAAAEAVGIARELAMTTYRTAEEFRQRFSMEPYRKGEAYRFEVEDYLAHHGAKFAGRFDPAHFLTLCLSLDLHSVRPEDIWVPTTVLAVREDTLVPLWQMRELAERLGEFGELVEISSLKGHDAFLVETETVGEVVRGVVG